MPRLITEKAAYLTALAWYFYLQVAEVRDEDYRYIPGGGRLEVSGASL